MLKSKSVIVSGPTIEELAKKINVPAENLVETVKRWNEQITAGADKDFGRPLEKKEAKLLSKDVKLRSSPVQSVKVHTMQLNSIRPS